MMYDKLKNNKMEENNILSFVCVCVGKKRGEIFKKKKKISIRLYPPPSPPCPVLVHVHVHVLEGLDN